MQETWVQSLGQEESLEKEVAAHSSILAWEIPCAEEPGRLQSMGCTESNMTAGKQQLGDRLSSPSVPTLMIVLVRWVQFYLDKRMIKYCKI